MFQICDLKKLKNLTTKCTIPTNPNSYWLTIIEKKKQKIQILSDLRLPCYLRIVPQKIIRIFWVQNRKKKRLKKNILTIYIVNDASNVKTVSKYYILKSVLCLSTKLFKRWLNLKRYFSFGPWQNTQNVSLCSCCKKTLKWDNTV